MLSKNTLLKFFLGFFSLSILVNNILQDFLLGIISFGLFALLYLVFVLHTGKYKKYGILFIFIFLGFLAGDYISTNHQNKIIENEKYISSAFLRSQDYTFEMIELFKKTDNGDNYKVKILEIDGKEVSKKIYGLTNIPSNYKLAKGDIFTTNLQLRQISNHDESFNYKKYMLAKNMYFTANVYYFEKTGKHETFLSKIDEFRTKVLNIVYDIYPDEEGILLAGILLGSRENIPKDLNEDFNNSGTTHIVAVSGSNITILIIFLGFVFKFFPVVLRSFLICGFLVLFCFFVGLEASVVRAGIMGIIGYFIMISGRKGNALTGVLLASAIMLLLNPLYINYDSSFQLSFLAVIGILYTNEFFQKVFKFIPQFFSLRESFVLTLSAMIFTLPIMMFDFGQFAILSPISNVLIGWTIPISMFFGFISIVGYFILPFLGKIIGIFAYVLLKWDITIIHFFGNLDSFIIKHDFGYYSVYLKILYFIVLFFVIVNVYLGKRISKR